ncbi:MAG: hypothetical protein U0Q12_12170 [Vicinamibacterales bacterium]
MNDLLDDVAALNDEELLSAFLERRISHRGWNHEAHVRTACIHAGLHDLDEAHLRLRAGIIRLNERHGLIESGARGYFETLTRAWLHLVDGARRRTGINDSRALIVAAPELLDRGLPLRYYSPPLLSSVRARSVFVPPDLDGLPDR